jgi:hypothetical protein
MALDAKIAVVNTTSECLDGNTQPTSTTSPTKLLLPESKPPMVTKEDRVALVPNVVIAINQKTVIGNVLNAVLGVIEIWSVLSISTTLDLAKK